MVGNHSYENDGFGILIREASHGVISGNNLHDNCLGILFLDMGTGADDWKVFGNQVNENNRVCELEEGFPVSGAGIVVSGGSDILITFNAVFGNNSDSPSIASGGIVVVSAEEDGGGDPENVAIVGNVALGNNPDLFWDETGSVVFRANICETSTPEGLCQGLPGPGPAQ